MLIVVYVCIGTESLHVYSRTLVIRTPLGSMKITEFVQISESMRLFAFVWLLRVGRQFRQLSCLQGYVNSLSSERLHFPTTRAVAYGVQAAGLRITCSN